MVLRITAAFAKIIKRGELDMRDMPIYIVTVMERLEEDKLGWIETGDVRNVCFFHDLEDAQYVVENNVGDINETIYNYAVIEEIPARKLYPHHINQWFYKFKSRDEWEYAKIEKPDFIDECTVFSIG